MNRTHSLTIEINRFRWEWRPFFLSSVEHDLTTRTRCRVWGYGWLVLRFTTHTYPAEAAP